MSESKISLNVDVISLIERIIKLESELKSLKENVSELNSLRVVYSKLFEDNRQMRIAFDKLIDLLNSSSDKSLQKIRYYDIFDQRYIMG